MKGLSKYREGIKRISAHLVKAQEPIRVLDAIKWDDGVYQKFCRARFKKLPQVDQAYYQARNLPFDLKNTGHDFRQILKDIQKFFSAGDPMRELLVQTTEEYLQVLELLRARGTPKFYEISRRLYGSPKDHFYGDTTTILSLSQTLSGILANLDDSQVGPVPTHDISAAAAVKDLRRRFNHSFLKGQVQVNLSDGIVADAAAGSSYIKINQGAQFSRQEIDILEVHEGWVHVATSLNGLRQSNAAWLAKGPPRCIATQEGLAVLMEVVTLKGFPERVRKINDRIRGIHLAENGADFLEVFEFYQQEGYETPTAFRNAMRVFRGGVITGGAPYTKDIAYCKGFIECYNFLRTAVRMGYVDLVRFFFVGKVNVRDIPLLYEKHREGIVDRPALLPPPFEDLSPLVVWMSFSNFLNQVNLASVQEDYQKLFKKFNLENS